MTKTEEILFATHEAMPVSEEGITIPWDFYTIKKAMERYAEDYARRCLKIAAEEADITCGISTKSYKSGYCNGQCDGGGCDSPVIIKETILDIKLPAHD